MQNLSHIFKFSKGNKAHIIKNYVNYFLPSFSPSLKIWGLNTRSLFQEKKQEDLYNFMKKMRKQPDIILMNETWLKADQENQNFFINNPDYFLISSNFDQNYQGTAILVKKKMKAVSVKQIDHVSKNFTEVQVRVNPENKISFMAFYVPPDGDAQRDSQRSEALDYMEKYFKSYKGKIVAYSDINQRLRDIDKPYNKQESDNIKKILKENKIKLVFDNNPYSFTRPSQSGENNSYIDFFFLRNLKIKKLKIQTPPIDSDHYLLDLKIKTRTPFKNMIYFALFAFIGYYFGYDQLMVEFGALYEKIIAVIGDKQSEENKRKAEQQVIKLLEERKLKDQKIQEQQENNHSIPVQEKKQDYENQNKKYTAKDLYYFLGFIYLAIKIMLNQDQFIQFIKTILFLN